MADAGVAEGAGDSARGAICPGGLHSLQDARKQELQELVANARLLDIMFNLRHFPQDAVIRFDQLKFEEGAVGPDLPASAQGAYSLSGCKVASCSQKGIYIQDGKKYISK